MRVFFFFHDASSAFSPVRQHLHVRSNGIMFSDWAFFFCFVVGILFILGRETSNRKKKMKSSKNARPAISGECVVCALAPELLSPPPIVVGPFRILLSLSLSVFWRSIFGDAFVAPLFIHTHTHKYLPI